jgi:Putative transposase/Transposase zinc-binding domain
MDRSKLPQREQPWGGVVPSVYSIIARHTDATMQKYGDRVCPHVESALLRMHFCRSTALGKRVYRCDPCNYETTVFNSCGDRNCPQCSGAKRSDWLDSTLQLTIPQATYFQVVFTLPESLSSLALGNRKEIYNLLFETAWESLRAKIEQDLGIQAAGVAVLHTWNQRLGHHPHVHMMVPGNGPSLDGKRWLDCRMVWCRKTRRMKPFLVDNKELGRDFRDLFLNRLTKRIEQGKIALEEAGYIADVIGELRLKDWVAFIEGPPKPDCPPSVMLKYLTRYLTGGPISNRRIVGEKDGRIWFLARSKKKGEGQVVTSLSNVEFVQQWSLHILPKEFTKTRHFGAWSGSKRRVYLDQCKALAPTVEVPCEVPCGPIAQAEGSKSPGPKRCHSCPHCQGEMRCIVDEDRPSWREIFYGPDHPAWFEWTSLGKCSPPDDPLEPAPNIEGLEEIEIDIFDEMIASRQE